MKEYKWDIAISLCKQDVDFARQLRTAFNPSLKVFFYEDNQDELISKNGAEAFAKVFKEESRIVIILSRNEWSESFYTDIERNAIIDRTSVKNMGYQFLVVIPMEPGQIPQWYPPTRIYADPRRFPIEELAKFIELKVTDEGGIIKPITFEDRHENLLKRIKEKEKTIDLQITPDAINEAQKEAKNVGNLFNEKSKVLQNGMFDNVRWHSFSERSDVTYFQVGSFLLECKFFIPDGFTTRIVTTQDYEISFELSKLSGNIANPIHQVRFIFYYSPLLKGWAVPNFPEYPSQKEMTVLFRNRNHSKFYDLEKPTPSHILIDTWFQKLLEYSSKDIEKYL